ncbi:MAG: hypothetical protein Q9168_007738 [Polycauliona sp. 1 TL-2023]
MDRLARRTNLPPERMTPIKVKGKRDQKARLRAQRKVRKGVEDADMAVLPMAAEPEVQCSRLELLPTEILESIFVYCRNLELPRASLVLGRALSSTGFKHLVLRAILIDPYLDGVFYYDEDPAHKLELAALQSALLRCRWLDEAMFMYALHQVRLVEISTFFQSSSRFCLSKVTGCPLADTSTSTIARFLESRKPDSRPCGWTSSSGSRFFMSFDIFSGKVVLREYDNPSWSGVSEGSICEFRLARGCEIPTKVLHGPWTDTKLNLLRALLNVWGALNWETSNNGEVANSSCREAILQGNTSFLQVLLRHYKFPVYASPITQQHLHLAIFEGGCKPEIVDLLLCYCRYDLQSDDIAILEWATAKDEMGDQRGTWLLQRIKDWQAKEAEGREADRPDTESSEVDSSDIGSSEDESSEDGFSEDESSEAESL